MIRRLRAGLPAAFIILCGLALFHLGTAGPDFQSYQYWARAFRTHIIYKLVSATISLQGVPFSIWSFGPGLIFSMERSGSYFVPFLFSLIFWWAFFHLLFLASRGDKALALFGAVAAFLGTPLGFYSFAYGSESLSYPCFALGLYRVLAPKKIGWTDALMAGIMAWFLIIIRVQLVLYCFLFLVPLAVRLLKEMAGRRKKTVYFLLAVVPPAVGLIQVAIVNRWMTGSYFKPPYVYEWGAFKSLDWRRPEFFAVLLNPLHGLLTYHPFYLPGFFSVAALIFAVKNKRERCLWAAGLCIFLLHLYLHAAQWVWWLGTNTFGMRGLGISAIIFVPAVVRLLSMWRKSGARSRNIFMSLAGLCCLWSYLLLTGLVTNFYTYHELAAFQRGRFGSLFSAEMAFSLLTAAAMAVAVRGKNKPAGGFHYFITCLLAFFCVHFLLSQYPGFYLIKIIFLALVPAASGKIFYPEKIIGTDDKIFKGVHAAVAGFFCVLCVIGTIQFARLAVKTGDYMRLGLYPKDLFFFHANVDVNEIFFSCQDFDRVPGFEKKKKAANDFKDYLVASSQIELTPRQIELSRESRKKPA